MRTRADATEMRVRGLNAAFQAFDLVDHRHPWVTIFATGSLGRHEIGAHSDLDAFIVDAARGEKHGEPRLSNLERYELVADLIRAAEGENFPPFSRDGEFLQVHRLKHLVKYLGKPDEDKLNVFTARMLLLLESHCLMGGAAYTRCADYVVDRYWKEDTQDHHFRPTFLINDVVRYWKALCLSYEGHRTEPGESLGPADRIDLLKLKFNRPWLCFNALGFLLLGDGPGSFSRDHAHRLVQLTPVARLLEMADEVPACAGRISEILDRYSWWLDRSQANKEEVHAWIGDDAHYEDASTRATNFGDSMSSLVNELGDRAGLTRYLLV